jgi:hypothetical protein
MKSSDFIEKVFPVHTGNSWTLLLTQATDEKKLQKDTIYSIIIGKPDTVVYDKSFALSRSVFAFKANAESEKSDVYFVKSKFAVELLYEELDDAIYNPLVILFDFKEKGNSFKGTKYLGKETLFLPVGKVEAYHFMHEKMGILYHYYFAEGIGYVRFRVVENGKIKMNYDLKEYNLRQV